MIKNSRSFIFYLYLVSVFLLFSIVTVSIIYEIPISKFTRDQAIVLNGTPFHGFLSNIGVLFWSWTSAIALFCYVLLKKNGDKSALAQFVLTGGILSSILLLDDFFMLHDWIFPKFFGANEKIIFLFYAVYLLRYLVKFKQVILAREYSLLLAAVFFFAFSLIVDTLPYSVLGIWHHLFEDGTKFLGIVSWFGYHVSLYYQEISSITTKKEIK